MDSNSLFFDHSVSRGNMLFLGSNTALFQGTRTMIRTDENPTRKRLFFSSTDDFIYDEEYYVDEQTLGKKRRLTSEQVNILEKSFEEENKLEPERKIELAKRLGLQPRQVAVWYQNRRARSKTKQLERDYDILRASYDALRLDYESLVEQTDKLRSEVCLLSEKIKAEEGDGPGSPRLSPFEEVVLEEPNKEAQQEKNKAEDRVSSGSSGVENPNLLVDSTCDSYYFDCLPTHCIPAVHSKEDDISDDRRSGYLSSMFAEVEAAGYCEEEEEEEEEKNGGQDFLGWWVWS